MAAHDKLHDITDIVNHNGTGGAVQNNLIAFDVNGLPGTDSLIPYSDVFLKDGSIAMTGNLTIGIGAVGVDYKIEFNGEDHDGTITWDEDENKFIFDKTIELDNNIQFSLDNIGTKYGSGQDAIIYYDGANMVYNSALVGTGYHQFLNNLEIYSASAHPILTITAAYNTSYDPQIQFRTGASPAVRASIGVDAATNNLVFYRGSGVGDTTHWVMDSSGNIGVGVAPSSLYRVYVQKTTTNPAQAYWGLYVYHYDVCTSAGLRNSGGLHFEMRTSGSTANNTGTIWGIQGNSLHDCGGAYSMAEVVGVETIFGNFSGGNVTDAKGFETTAFSWYVGTTVTNSYDIYLNPARKDGGGTITNEWAIYSNHTAPSRLIDDLRIQADSKHLKLGEANDCGMTFNGTDAIVDFDLLNAGTTDYRLQQHGTDRFVVLTGGKCGFGISTPVCAVDIDDDAGGTDLGYMRMEELSSDPSEPAANYGVLYLRDNGAGKTQLCVGFNGGGAIDVHVLATQT